MIFQANVSFDHYFATYPHAANPPGQPHFSPKPGTPTVNGLTPQLIADNPRYAQALNHGDDVIGFARGLVNGGYATDPGYAQKIAAIANSPAMREALDGLKKLADAPNSSE